MRTRWIAAFTCLLVSSLAAAGERAPADPAERLDRLAEQCWDGWIELHPTFATAVGDHRWDDRFSDGLSAAWRDALGGVHRRCLEGAAEIDRAALDDERRTTLDLLVFESRVGLEGLRFPHHLLPVSADLGSPAQALARAAQGDGGFRFQTPGDFEAFRSRMDGFADWVELAVAAMREGVKRGIVQPCSVSRLALEQLDDIAERPLRSSPFMAPLDDVPRGLDRSERRRLVDGWKVTVEDRVIPAYRRLREVMRREYLPACRESLGLGALPGGEAWYAWRVRAATTTELTPEEIFDLGAREVARIIGELEQEAAGLGFSDGLTGLYTALYTDRRLVLSSQVAALRRYQEIQTRVEGALPRFFGRLPRAELEVRPVEGVATAGGPGAYYLPASPDGARPGTFYVRIGEGGVRTPGMEALFLHEAIPGHHLQISVANELEGLPPLRRFARHTAFIEGWALYAESLGGALGLYADPYQRVGRLQSELLRAARLVLDVGIHQLGWSRDQATEIARTRLLGSGAWELDRYASDPAQALGYKVGELRLLALRDRAEAELGPAFDLAAFHDVVLGGGSLPLGLVEERVGRWISAQKPPAAVRQADPAPR